MARKITVQATAYGPPWDAMEGTGVTSTGVDLRKGQQKLVVAVDPNVIPYGTKLKIPDNPFGNPDLIFTAADTGGAIKGNRLDFFVASGRKDQNRWGRRNTTVEVVGRGSPKDVAVLGGQQQPRAAVAPAAVRPAAGATTTTTGPNQDARRQIIASWLLSNSSDPLHLATQLAAVPQTTTTQTTPGRSSSTNSASPSPGASPTVRFRQAANKINAQHLPYSWGGGHASKTAPGAGVPLDCSGAVSSVLGINPRVASQFKTFGSPGPAPGGKGVTVYAKDTHVLLEIDGHFFGTSATNPGGGAGWIPRSAISPDYLKGFVARHLADTVHG